MVLEVSRRAASIDRSPTAATATGHRFCRTEHRVPCWCKCLKMENQDYQLPGAGVPQPQPGIRPLVDPEAHGEVDPTL